MDLIKHLRRQREWSQQTFGPGTCVHPLLMPLLMRKELCEIKAIPGDLVEWIDIVILALDGAWRAGYEPEEISAEIEAKQIINENRQWPDWRTVLPPDRVIEDISSSK